jgi:hypothetical protein
VQRAHRNSTLVLNAVLVVVGIALIVSTLARGGGPGAIGIVVGILFTLLGAARIYLASGRSLRRKRS